MHKKFKLPLILTILILTGFFLESSDFFSRLKNNLRNRDIPSPLLNFGKRGQVMRELGLKYMVPTDKISHKKKGIIIKLNVSQLNLKEDWIAPEKIKTEELPSSSILPKTITNQKISIISIVAGNDDLYDEYTGILSNALKKGRNWERPCYVSFFKNGNLKFGTGAGLRVHGGSSRKHNQKSFRLYFRKMYGHDKIKENLFFKGTSDPLKEIIIRKEKGAGINFLNPISYDITKKIGCIAPNYSPTKLYLNGKKYASGNYVLTERINKDFLKKKFGHDNFVFLRTAKRIRKEKMKRHQPAKYLELLKWSKNKNKKLTLKETEKRIDIDNFIKWWISVLFLGNTDPYQGLAVLDLSNKNGKWFWIKFDMDHCIRNLHDKKISHFWEQEGIFHDLMKTDFYHLKTDPRPIIFKRLITEDPQFKNLFFKETINILKNKLNNKFFTELLTHYKQLSLSFKMTDMSKMEELELFVKKRPAYLLKLMKKYFNTPDQPSLKKI